MNTLWPSTTQQQQSLCTAKDVSKKVVGQYTKQFSYHLQYLYRLVILYPSNLKNCSDCLKEKSKTTYRGKTIVHQRSYFHILIAGDSLRIHCDSKSSTIVHTLSIQLSALWANSTHLCPSCSESRQRWPNQPPSWPLNRDTTCSVKSTATRTHSITCAHAYTQKLQYHQGHLYVPTSVVMTMQEALGLIVVSPVISPTSRNCSYISRYFWLLRALMGVV